MNLDDFHREDPDFYNKLNTLDEEFGLRDYDRFKAHWKDIQDRKFPAIFADSAENYIAKTREALEAWTADYESRLVAENQAETFDLF